LVEISEVQSQTVTLADLLVLILLTVAAYTDLRWRRIFNWITYPMLGWAAVIAMLATVCQQFAIDSSPLGTLSLSGFLAGAVGCGLMMLIPYRMSGGGAGDVKLAIALGGLMGFHLASGAIAAGYLLAASWLLFRSIWEHTSWLLISGLVRQLGQRCVSVPIGPPTSRQQAMLAQPMPLAGFFGLGALFVRIGGLPW
jgi:Flp pilus assembly protein protease CpaA